MVEKGLVLWVFGSMGLVAKAGVPRGLRHQCDQFLFSGFSASPRDCSYFFKIPTKGDNNQMFDSNSFFRRKPSSSLKLTSDNLTNSEDRNWLGSFYMICAVTKYKHLSHES